MSNSGVWISLPDTSSLRVTVQLDSADGTRPPRSAVRGVLQRHDDLVEQLAVGIEHVELYHHCSGVLVEPAAFLQGADESGCLVDVLCEIGDVSATRVARDLAAEGELGVGRRSEHEGSLQACQGAPLDRGIGVDGTHSRKKEQGLSAAMYPGVRVYEHHPGISRRRILGGGLFWSCTESRHIRVDFHLRKKAGTGVQGQFATLYLCVPAALKSTRKKHIPGAFWSSTGSRNCTLDCAWLESTLERNPSSRQFRHCTSWCSEPRPL